MSMAAFSATLSSSFGPSLPQRHEHGSARPPNSERMVRLVPKDVRTEKSSSSAPPALIHEILPIFPQDVLRSRRMDIVADVRRSLLRQEPPDCIVMIDELQRLAIDYHFQDEIEFLLGLHSEHIATARDSDLFSAALSFRLRRQRGHYAPPSHVFHEFMEKHRRGGVQIEEEDEVRGLLALYEASHLGIEGEELLDEVCRLSKQLLLQTLDAVPATSKEVRHSLQHPIHKSLPRLALKSYLKSKEDEVLQVRRKMLHELAIIDFNCVQAMYRKELDDVCLWWTDLDIANELHFARDNPLEWFICSLAILSDPKFSKYRILLAKSISFIYLIDDMYDAYGTVDQLTKFTEAVKRWEANELEGLPQCMKTCFMALSDVNNDVSDMIIKEQGSNPSSTLRKLWAGLCDAFLEEHRWFATSYWPKSDEYLRNGIISTGAPLSLALACLMLGKDSPNSTMDEVQSGQGLFSTASAIFRLSDDLGSSMQHLNHKGHDGCYVDYYMKEVEGASLQDALEHVRGLISHQWKVLNKECLSGKFSRDLRLATMNLVRMSQWMYPDDISHHGASKEMLKSLLQDIQI